MILAFDTFYFENKAKTVCLKFDYTEKNLTTYSEIIENCNEYIPGEFYRRELPCIISLLKQINTKDVNLIIVDGFVYLDDNFKMGLGAHLFKSLQNKIPIIGVAKTNFATIEELKISVFRGKSKKPLYVSSIGIGLKEAAKMIEDMDGEYRIPNLLKTLDNHTKDKTACNRAVTSIAGF